MRPCPPTSLVCRTARDIVLALLVFLIVFVLVLAESRTASSASSMAPAQAAAAKPTADGPRSGTLLLRNRDGDAALPVLDLGSDVDIAVNGPIARATVTQRFRNASEHWAQGAYVFPLPDQASVDSLRIEIGERVVEGRIVPRDRARALYEQRKSGRPKTNLIDLIKQQHPNLFTSAVTDIAPGETVTVRFEYQETVQREDGAFSLRFPLATAPHYDGSSASNMRTARYAPNQASDDSISRPVRPSQAGKTGPVSLQVMLDPGFELGTITGRHHKVTSKRTSDGRAILSLADGAAPADKDFELTWTPKALAEPQLALYRETVGETDYLLAMVTPPAPTETTSLPAREVVFVIDTSGSMAGTAIEQAEASLLFALDRLQVGDRFNIIRFSDDTETLFKTSVDASPENLARARSFMHGLSTSGGTETTKALQAALADATPHDPRLRQIVLLTDGAIREEAAAFTAIAHKRGRSRLFLVGIGSAPNTYFMRRATELGRGAFVHIDTADQVQARMRDLFAKLERPAVTDLRADWAPGLRVEAWPTPLPDLYAGEPAVMAARLSSFRGGMKLAGTLNGKPWSKTIKLAEARRVTGIGKLWAGRKIAALEARHWSGQDPVTISDAIRSVAMDHHLVSSETGLVAVDTSATRAGETAAETTDIPVNFPATWEYDAGSGSRNADPRPPARESAAARPKGLSAATSEPLRVSEATPGQNESASAKADQPSALPADSLSAWYSNRLLIVAVMALFFATMVAVTLGFWRHLGRDASTRRNGRGI